MESAAHTWAPCQSTSKLHSAAVPYPPGCSTSWPESCSHCTGTGGRAANTPKLKPGSRSGNPHTALHRRTTQTRLTQPPRLNRDNWVHIKQTTSFHMKPSAVGNSRCKQLFVTAWTLFSAKKYLHTNNGCEKMNISLEDSWSSSVNPAKFAVERETW